MKYSSIIIPVLLLLGYLFYEKVYKAPKYQAGDEVAEIHTTLIDGTSFTLSDLEGKYVLLDFWGSWCPPCRQENPELVKLNQEMQNHTFAQAEGFDIVSIGVESSEASWKRAILQDGLDWKYHIIQTDRFKSPLPQLYNVKEIPTKYLLDTNGDVLLVNPTFADIYTYLRQG